MESNYILTLSEKDNSHQIQTKIVDTIIKISSEINCQKIIVNTQIAASLADSAHYTVIPNVTLNDTQIYVMGTIQDIEINVDPNMRWNETNVTWTNGRILQIILNESQLLI